MCVGARGEVGKPWVTFLSRSQTFICWMYFHRTAKQDVACFLLSITFLIVLSPVFTTKGNSEDGKAIANEDTLIARDNC